MTSHRNTTEQESSRRATGRWYHERGEGRRKRAKSGWLSVRLGGGKREKSLGFTVVDRSAIEVTKSIFLDDRRNLSIFGPHLFSATTSMAILWLW